MALFQQSVITKHLNAIDKKQLESKWIEYSAHFLNSSIQAQIRNLKEEQYQGEFLEDLFVKILGYTKAPQPNHNLITEQKNQTNSKKADGAILITDSKGFQTVRAVIELKGTDTTDLSKIETQAFGYKNNQPECVYVITSNFEKIRFYIENAVDFIEFNLFTLSRKDFDLLYCCLAYENIKANSPKHLKDESVSKESQITKQLYKDYSDFKRALYNNLVEKNPQIDKLLLFKKTQKLLDRFLFVFFAEDRQLVPTNLIRRINLEWENLKKARIQVSLYDRYKVYFEDLNTGAKVTLPAFGKNTGDATTAEFEIFAYNGGLFLPDEILDNVQIDDEILHKHSILLSDYDFDSDVDVNILGHIFENSLNEIDEIKSEIEGNVIDKTKTKRKKDGVFYTPKYITKYIVENTVGKLCEEKKAEFAIIDEEFAKGRKNRNKTTIQKLDSDLQSYRDWLLQITICDPACGSGAFLNQALEFLIQEHKYIDELQAQLFGSSIGFPGAELHILENNIYGVDLNDESVEIAKLSLWLRTAQKGRKLNSLNNNIKAGNSLIDDPAVAGDKAFSWEKEFPEVFKEKNKFSYHITTSLHDSRTSDRMIQFKARERRFEGTKPEPEVFPMTKEEEELIARTVAEIVKEDNLDIAAFNLCWDHMHILLVCEEDEVPKIMQKIKAKTAREVNIFRGKTIVSPREHAPLTDMDTEKHAPLTDMDTEKHAPLTDMDTEKHASLADMDTEKNAPLPKRGEKQNSFWTQKYGCKPITSEEHFWNTYNYIEDNKVKHKLPNNPKLKSIISTFVKSFEECFKTKYSGGFDVIIGNPPYVRKQGLIEHYPEMCKHYEHRFVSATANYDIYALFMERTFELINEKGIVSYILPHKFLVTDFGEGIRRFFKENTCVESLIHFGSEIVFADAATYTCIVNLTKRTKEKILFKKLSPNELLQSFDWDYMSYKNLSSSNWDLQSEKVFDVISKLNKQPFRVEDVFDKIFQGIATSLDDIYVFHGEKKGTLISCYNEKYKHHFEIEEEFVKPIIGGRDIFKYNTPEIKSYVIFPYNLKKNGAPFEESFVVQNFPLAYDYLKKFEKEIKGRERGRMNVEKGWFNYIYPKNLTYFQNPKIMTREISLGCNMTYDSDGKYYHNTKVYSFIKNEKFKVDEKFYLAIMNSAVMWFFLKNTGSEYGGGYYVFKTNYLKPFPLPKVSENSVEIISKVNFQLARDKEFQILKKKFSNYFAIQHKIEKLNTKLEKWCHLTFPDFIKELNKAIKAVGGVELTKKDEFEWMDLFEENKKKALELKAEIDKTDKEIDQMVYALYGLTEEEIKIVEGVTS